MPTSTAPPLTGDDVTHLAVLQDMLTHRRALVVEREGKSLPANLERRQVAAIEAAMRKYGVEPR